MPGRIAFEFVLDELATVTPRVRAMFGSHAIYVDEKMMLIVRQKGDDDDGVWVATSHEHHESLRKELPSMRKIELLGGKITAWQNIYASSPTFEREAVRACELILRCDPRIGKVPKAKKPKAKPAGAKSGGSPRVAKNKARGR